MKRKTTQKITALAMAACLLIPSFSIETVEARTQSISLKTAQSVGFKNSTEYALMKSELESLKVERESSVAALKLQEKRQKSFSWSPLLSFSLPETPSEAESYNYEYTPLELQSELDSKEHELDDEKNQINYDVANFFVSIYLLQEEIAYNEERLETYQKALTKNEKRLELGTGSQEDVDSIQSKVDSIEDSLTADKTDFEAKKKSLSTLIGIDVRSGYTFESPFVDGELDRTDLEYLIDYTLKNSQTYYEAQVETENALTSLNTNYKIMKNHYGSSDMSIIDSYITQARNGDSSLDKSAFKLAYKDFLTKIDSYWTGKKKIWFVKIPKAWFKGDTDGINYISDDQYVLYQNALDYLTAIQEQENIKQEITDEVTESFENYISTKKSLNDIDEQLVEKKEEVDKDKTLNLMGQMTYDEYADVQDEYEGLQLEKMQTWADYSDILYSLNRLTCDAIAKKLNLKTVSVSSDTSSGTSFAVETEGSGVYYYIKQLASESVFELGLTVTDDADVSLTDFELWVDGTQIGERTSLSGTIRHLTFDLESTQSVIIRIYNNNEFVDDCEIDPTVYSAKLDITTGYTVETEEDDQVGRYGIETNSNGTVTINFIPDMDTDYEYYSIMTEDGDYLINDEQISISKDFTYLQLAKTSLEDLVINLYSESGSLEYQAKFDTSDKTLRKITE